jgi:hypothetical protein
MRRREGHGQLLRCRCPALLVTTCTLVIGCLFVLSPTVVGATTQPLTVTTPYYLPDGTVGQSYSYQLQASGGTPPYNWVKRHPDSVLPYGLSMSSSGVISGVPVVAGTDDFTVIVQDTTGSYAYGYLQLTVETGTALDPSLVPLGTELYRDQPSLPGQLNALLAELSDLYGIYVYDTGCGLWWSSDVNQELGLAGPFCPLPPGLP